MSKEHPIVQVPKGWTYDETAKFDFGRWVTTYTLKHDACGKTETEVDNPVGNGGDGWWYRQKCAEGLAFFLGNHSSNCTAGATDGNG